MQGPIYSRGPFDAQPQIPGGGRESLQTNTNKAKFKEKLYHVSLPYVKTEGHCFILISFEIGKIGEKFSTFDAEISGADARSFISRLFRKLYSFSLEIRKNSKVNQ